jgi:hypothetical protein
VLDPTKPSLTIRLGQVRDIQKSKNNCSNNTSVISKIIMIITGQRNHRERGKSKIFTSLAR